MNAVAVDTQSFSYPYSFISPINSGYGDRDVPIIKREGTTGVGLFAIPGLGGSLWEPKIGYFDRKATEGGHAFVSFGYSEFNRPELIIRDFSIERMVAEGVEVFQSQTEGPQIIVAHSFGANIALTLLRDYPERVKGVVLLSPGTEIMRDLVSPILAKGNEETQIRRRAQFDKPEDGFCSIPLLYHCDNGQCVPRTVRAKRNDLLAYAEKEVFHNRSALIVESEVIILHDPKDDRIPISSSVELAKKIIIQSGDQSSRQPRLVRTPGAGHDHNIQRYSQKVVWTHVDRLLSTARHNLG